MEEIGFSNPYKLKPNKRGVKPMHLINQKHNIFPQIWAHEQYMKWGKIRKIQYAWRRNEEDDEGKHLPTQSLKFLEQMRNNVLQWKERKMKV